MQITNQRKQEIVAAFQRSLKANNREEIEGIDLVELNQADIMLGNRDINAGFRLAMQNRIEKLESLETIKEQRKHESKIRAWKLVTGIIVALVIAGLAGWLFG